jgi:hypothetical protein
MYIDKENMKLSIGFYIAIVILCIVLATTLSTSYNVVPYSSNSLYSNQTKFEGFHGMRPANYSTYPDNKTIDMKDRFLINDTSADKNAQRIWGFDGLFGPYQTPENKLDIYTDSKTALSCANTSSGLSKSTGYLCLDEKQMSMLKTRGGNQTGKPCQIGM